MDKPSAKDLAPASFNGRPVAHQDHLRDIESRAATHEFGGPMSRQQAEDRAYEDYLHDPKSGQHVLAAAHHLAGMKAAHAAGDLEAARKHAIMYNLHSRALGHEPVGPAHPAVAAQLEQAPPRVYKFKAHPGDLFALEKPAAPAADQLGKALNKVYEAFAPLAKAERKTESPTKGTVLYGSMPHPDGSRRPHPFHVTSSTTRELVVDGGMRTVPHVWGHWEGQSPAKAGWYPMRALVSEADKGRMHEPAQEPNAEEVKKSLSDWAKSELAARKTPKKNVPCVCTSYPFPHRHRGGKCGK